MSTKKILNLKSKIKTNSKTRTKRNYKVKSGSNDVSIKLLRTLSNNLIQNASSYNENQEKLNKDYRVSLTPAQKKAINYYQESSILVNGFLRKGYQIFSEFKKITIINDLKANNYNNAIKELINKIKLLDKAFTKPNCPKTTQPTILYRGTDTLYSGINKGFISCSKTIEAIFDMNFSKGEKILSDNCCINVLVVDQNIPYLDLENNNNKIWSYQQEVLLPRGLNTVIIKESTFQYNNIDFKVYVMRVMLNNDENVYTIPELPKDDRVDMKIMKFIIDKQRDEIVNLFDMFISNRTDEKQMINDLIEEIYNMENKDIFTQEQYSDICMKILNTLRKTIPAMMESAIVREECKPNLKPVLDKVNILLDKNPLITPDRFIQVNKC